jgi:hypothetical protein
VRTVARTLLALTASVLVVAGLAGTAHAAQPSGGITITPAALTLRLTKGSNIATAPFSVGNSYTADIALHFAIEKSSQPGDADTARAHMAFAASDITVQAGGSSNQTLTLSDASSIAPGSQTATLVISYGSGSGQGVGVLPSMRLPITVIKEDGAVTSLGLTKIAGPSIALAMPSDTTVTIRNTGNVVAIPRGTVRVTTSDGQVLAQGVLNEASRAVSPGSDIKLATKLTRTGGAWAPGPYQIRITYGLGGDSTDNTSSVSFLFIAWWHLLAAGLLAAGVWYAVTHRPFMRPERYKKHRGRSGPPKRQLLVGRNGI